MTAFSNYLEQKILGVSLLGSSFTAPTTVYLSLATSVASDGDFFTEVTTNIGYSRLPIDFSEPTSANDYTCVNSADLTFTQATSAWGTITHVGIYDAEAIGGGNQLYWGAVTTQRTIETDDVFEISAGELSILLS